MKAKDLKKVREYVLQNGERYQQLWDEFQKSNY
ncbi:DUF4160 domain-containing protein [Streptococcus sp. S784/96/1]|nr:DUF4160 domain-containing protein [Streptococcus sp. S784/96/1]